MLQVNNLTFARDERILFSDLSFQVNAGEILQIDGENGVGKTTLLRILCGLIPVKTGQVLWQGIPIVQQQEEWHRQLFWLGQQTGNKSCLTVLENLQFWYPKVSLKQIEQALNRVALNGYEHQKFQQLSSGQQRRVALAGLWLTESKLWILDEPMTALDKAGIQLLSQRFRQHSQAKGLLILTTHQAWLNNRLPMRHLSLQSLPC